MNKDIVVSAVDTLLNQFWGEKRNQYIGIRSMELYFQIGVFNDIRLTAQVLEEQRAFNLLEPMRLYDVTAAEQIEGVLMGI